MMGSATEQRQIPAQLAGLHRETKRVQRIYQRLSGRYDAAIQIVETIVFGDGRRWVCEQARGTVLEIAIGTGRNLPHYPDDVRVTGIDLSLAMLQIAQQRRARGCAAALTVGDAQTLPFPDACFDTVVATLALCSIPDDRLAVREAYRVLRPGGLLLLLEHVRSPLHAVQRMQRLIDPLTVRLQADHMLREPLDYLAVMRFVVDRCERSALGIAERLVAHKRAE